MAKPNRPDPMNVINEAIDTVGRGADEVVRLIARPVRIANVLLRTTRRPKPGARPGIDHLPEAQQPPEPGKVSIQCIDYGPDRCEHRPVDDVQALLAEPRPDWATVRWVNVEGLNAFTIKKFQDRYELHDLAAEDVLNVPQRPKCEMYDEHLFIVARMMRIRDDRPNVEQVSLFMTDDGSLITFQEHPGDVWQPVRERIEREGSRLRTNGADYLLYALLDAIVDHYFVVLETFGDRLEAIEDQLLASPEPEMVGELHTIKRELLIARRVVWPMREALDALCREEHDLVSVKVRPFFRGIYDHAIQVLDLVETCRDMTSGLNDLYMSAVSNRMNEVMKVLTIIATLFIPITFIAGVYGMNLRDIPEVEWAYAYPLFWATCAVIVIGLLIFFRRKRWL